MLKLETYFVIIYLRPSGMNDEKVSINGDEEDGEGGEEHAGGLGRSNHLADYFLIIMSALLSKFSPDHNLGDYHNYLLRLQSSHCNNDDEILSSGHCNNQCDYLLIIGNHLGDYDNCLLIIGGYDYYLLFISNNEEENYLLKASAAMRVERMLMKVK